MKRTNPLRKATEPHLNYKNKNLKLNNWFSLTNKNGGMLQLLSAPEMRCLKSTALTSVYVVQTVHLVYFNAL